MFNKLLIGALAALLIVTSIGATVASAAPATDPSTLDAQEAAALLFMREEEKLARDVYNVLYATWGLPVFKNIAVSEQRHMDAIKVLLDRYGLTDPALAPGKFSDPTLQALYDKLVAQGKLSVTEALKVGVTIEQVDIKDLQTRIAQTDNLDIQRVYTNLLNGSNSHLQAFSRNTATTGGQLGGTRHSRGPRW